MIDLKMKQWVTNQNGLDQLELMEVPAPERLGDDEVFVKINAVSLNYRDTEGELRRLHPNPGQCDLILATHTGYQSAWVSTATTGVLSKESL